MDEVRAVLIGGGLFAFGIVMILYKVQEKFPRIKGNPLLKWLDEALMFCFMACMAGVVLLLIWGWLNQPTGMELCMAETKGWTDSEAIAWMEDYCSQRNIG